MTFLELIRGSREHQAPNKYTTIIVLLILTRANPLPVFQVQHRGLRDTCTGDVDAVCFVVSVVDALFPKFSYKWLADEIEQNIPKELNFLLEANNSRRWEPGIAYVAWPRGVTPVHVSGVPCDEAAKALVLHSPYFGFGFGGALVACFVLYVIHSLPTPSWHSQRHGIIPLGGR